VAPGDQIEERRSRTRRDELRGLRQQAILDTALDVLRDEGLDALTTQRIAERLDCGVATVYRLFASKDALLAELTHQALDTLHASWLAGLAHLDDDAGPAGLPPATVALARAMGAAWFWVVAEDEHSAYMDLSRRLFVDRQIVVPDEQATKILPAALRILSGGCQLLDDAVEHGALVPGNSVDRSVVVVASVTGVVLTAKFARWDVAIFDPRRLAAIAVQDHFAAWGAAPEALEAAFGLVQQVAEAGRLAPALD
jgi:AcrR family transcriptional regulator